MKLLRKTLDNVEQMLNKNDKLKRFLPLYDAMDTFFYGLPHVTPDRGPQIRDNLDLKRYMITVVMAVSPCAIASIYFFGWKAVQIIMISYIFGLTAEVISAMIRKETINEGAFVTCILYPLILPPTTPWWIAAVGIVVGIVFGKEAFGGTGRNIFNPALIARCFVMICFPKEMGTMWLEPFKNGLAGFAQWSKIPFMATAEQVTDAVTSATPLSMFKTEGIITSTKDLFLGSTAGSFGETSALLIILGGLYLIFTKVGSWRLALSPIIGAVVFSAIMHAFRPEQFADPVFTILSGGLLFGAFFMVTDPVSATMTNSGKWIYGLMIGFLAVLIRGLSSFPEGMMFAILIMNIFAPVIDSAVFYLRYRKKEAVA